MASISLFEASSWFARVDALITVDPANIHLISPTTSKDHLSSKKGRPDFHCRLRAIQESKNVFSGHPQPGFQNLSMSVSRVTKDGTILDLQDVFQRFIFDTTLVITTRSDPQSLSIDMPQVEFAIVVEYVGEAMVG
uniref:Uncharacterized protein n=1 Tax=Brassica oleracea TaxID=3712 RepID=A0A3P6B0K3_BRAOL|nr:unnamed protein product [Brassica oleracea]